MSDAQEHDFNTWLDSLVAGRSTPATGDPAHPDMTGMRAAARKLHQLARMAEADSDVAGNDDPRFSTWSTFMQDHASTLPPPFSSTPSRRSRPRVGPWLTGLNIAMAAMLIVAMAAGLWRLNENANRNGSGGDGNLAFAPETRTFEPYGTPEVAAGLPPVPTADECTVEPLSIDTVLWYYAEPGLAEGGWTSADSPPGEQGSQPDSPDAQPGGWVHEDGTVEIYTVTPSVDSLMGSPPSETEPGPASPDQLASMVSLQRMWMACGFANSPFQRWALESPSLVAAQLDQLFPTFTSESEARSILQSLKDSVPLVQAGTPPAELLDEGLHWSSIIREDPAFQSVAVIEPDSAETWSLDGRVFWSSYSEYDTRGDRLSDGDNSELYLWTPVPGAPVSLLPWISGEGNCFWFGFTWYPDRNQLLLSSYPICG